MELREELQKLISQTTNNVLSVSDNELPDRIAKLVIQHDLENGTKIEHHPPEFYDTLNKVAFDLVETLRTKGAQYGNSWISRGGVGAFMMMTRKIDRIINQLKKPPIYDIVEHCRIDTRDEGIQDDLRDLTAYCLLILTWLEYTNVPSPGTDKI